MKNEKPFAPALRNVFLVAALIASFTLTAAAASQTKGSVGITFVEPGTKPPASSSSSPSSSPSGGSSGSLSSGGSSSSNSVPSSATVTPNTPSGGTGTTDSTSRTSGGTATRDSDTTRTAGTAGSTTIDEGDVPLGSVSILDPSVPLSSLPALPKTGTDTVLPLLLLATGAVFITAAKTGLVQDM